MNIQNYDNEVQIINRELMTARTNMSNDLVGVCDRLLEKAEEVGDINLIGYAYYYLADAYYKLSTEYRKFNENLLKAIEYLQMCGDKEHIIRCYNLFGIDALNHGNIELALDFFLNGIRDCDEYDKNSAVGFVECNIGLIYYDVGEIETALSYIQSGYKHIRKNKEDSLYYLNVLLCYCNEAECYILLDKPESVKKCLLAIKRLESDPRVKSDYFQDILVLDVRMRGNYVLGNMEEYQKYSELLLKTIQTENFFSVDNIDDIYRACRFLMKIGRVDEVEDIVKNVEATISSISIAYLRKQYAKIKCELYSLKNDDEQKYKAYEEFYTYSMAQEKEGIANYRFFTDIREKLSEMERENIALLKKAETDSLTGLGNRYGLNEYADKAFDNAYANQKSLAVEILDVDNFKQYNDTFGHQAGDTCLKTIAEIIVEKCGGNNKIRAFRYGGDEFVIVYEDMTDEEVMWYASNIRLGIKERNLLAPSHEYGKLVTISQGICNSVPISTNKLWDYMYAADNALYEVKEHRKGEIVMLHKVLISQESLDEAKYS
ncbi:MAG: GGDEF domain-containing protein [Butyrivibrio sp.]|nr:GGDEF domain-containing protein [Butyrivibrio sp.]